VAKYVYNAAHRVPKRIISFHSGLWAFRVLGVSFLVFPRGFGLARLRGCLERLLRKFSRAPSSRRKNLPGHCRALRPGTDPRKGLPESCRAFRPGTNPGKRLPRSSVQASPQKNSYPATAGRSVQALCENCRALRTGTDPENDWTETTPGRKLTVAALWVRTEKTPTRKLAVAAPWHQTDQTPTRKLAVAAP